MGCSKFSWTWKRNIFLYDTYKNNIYIAIKWNMWHVLCWQISYQIYFPCNVSTHWPEKKMSSCVMLIVNFHLCFSIYTFNTTLLTVYLKVISDLFEKLQSDRIEKGLSWAFKKLFIISKEEILERKSSKYWICNHFNFIQFIYTKKIRNVMINFFPTFLMTSSFCIFFHG